ncbi:coiled-coil domain-containing protein-domain-containing protein [Xylariaceae sp. FL0804]|nr:coiled-coil domain-containing protein-domain-containing protein [Xylariaceae sp. FL0804]
MAPVSAWKLAGAGADADSASTAAYRYERPRPRPARSPAHAAQVRRQNRRREWLERNPAYVDSAEHELADPLLYDALVRRFQSAEEREREGRARGYGRTLETDLLRGEARLAHLAGGHDDHQNGADSDRGGGREGGPFGLSAHATDGDAYIREYAMGVANEDDDVVVDDIPVTLPKPSSLRRSGLVRQGSAAGPGDHRADGAVPAAAAAAAAAAAVEIGDAAEEDKEEEEDDEASAARARWHAFLRRRFVLGRDDDFDYGAVDGDDALDAIERREQQDAWFDDEEPSFLAAGDGEDEREKQERQEEEEEEKSKGVIVERPLTGETGVQDF